MDTRAVFVGLCTIDIIHRAPRMPQSNEKVVAHEQLCVAGGPAANAAVAFAHLSGRATLVTALGAHPLTRIVRDDLLASNVLLDDLIPHAQLSPTVSSIVVTEETGDRAVVSTNATRLEVPDHLFRGELLDGARILMVDGHHMNIALAAARKARARGIPVVLDGGSWKEGTEALLPYINVAICSERFVPPACGTGDDVRSYLSSLGVPASAITRGERSILYRCGSDEGELAVPRIRAVDTLGAGDILHGAFCAFIVRSGMPFEEALGRAARVATDSCGSFGTRAWRMAHSGGSGAS